MIFLNKPRRREFTLRGRRKASKEVEKRFDFRRAQRIRPSRVANTVWLIVLLALVFFLVRYFRSLNW